MSYRGTVSMADLLCLGWTLLFRGKYPEAHVLSQEALTLCEDTGQRAAVGWVLVRLASARLHLGRYEEARAQAQMSLTLAREVGSRLDRGSSLRLLGSVALVEEAYSEAQQFLQESVAMKSRPTNCVCPMTWRWPSFASPRRRCTTPSSTPTLPKSPCA